ncbi:MAG: ABC transporter substrate-binding protein [bacterium]|nr:ABC transporter substrate-binding protein [bacterium]
MRRREFIALVGGAAVALPSAVHGQRAKPVIAILGSGAAEASSSRLQMSLLDAGMSELGLAQGQDYVFEARWAGSDASRFSELAAELLTSNPVAVVVSTNLAAIAVQKRSKIVPIVGTGLNAPVATGLIASLNRPGGNITGVSTMAEDVLLKLYEIMREALPAVGTAMLMMNPTNPSNLLMADLLKDQGKKDRIAILAASVSAPADLDAAFAQISRERPGALFMLTDNSLFALADTVVARALELRVPTFGGFGGTFGQTGALIAYSRDAQEAFRGVARLLKKILAGAAPGELPFEQPTKFNLIVNLKTAKALDIEIPPRLLATAYEVIE